MPPNNNAEAQGLRAAVVNPGVLGASNPTNFGHHHGPITNNNHGWIPPSHQAVIALGNNRFPAVSAAENATAPNAGSTMSSVNGLVCDIIVDPNTSAMCGITFTDQPGLRRHIRTAHPGALVNPSRQNTGIQENTTGQNALRRWVLTQGWKNANYVHEPGHGSANSLIRRYCDDAERLATLDAQFAQQYGREFHRQPSIDIPTLPSSGLVPKPSRSKREYRAQTHPPPESPSKQQQQQHARSSSACPPPANTERDEPSIRPAYAMPPIPTANLPQRRSLRHSLAGPSTPRTPASAKRKRNNDESGDEETPTKRKAAPKKAAPKKAAPKKATPKKKAPAKKPAAAGTRRSTRGQKDMEPVGDEAGIV